MSAKLFKKQPVHTLDHFSETFFGRIMVKSILIFGLYSTNEEYVVFFVKPYIDSIWNKTLSKPLFISDKKENLY